MSAQHIFDHAPLGSLIGYSNGAPKPPARFVNKLRAWSNENGAGRLIRKDPARRIGTHSSQGNFSLHGGSYSSGGTVVMIVRHSHCVTSPLAFSLIERPAQGSILVVKHWGGSVELLHMAANRTAAEVWLQTNRHSDAFLEEVPDETLSSQLDLGRVA